jgi:hypothetical protein
VRHSGEGYRHLGNHHFSFSLVEGMTGSSSS